MTFDYSGFLYTCTEEKDLSSKGGGLASGFVDECTVQSCKGKQMGKQKNPKQEARQHYMKNVSNAIPKSDSKAKTPNPDGFLKKYCLSTVFENSSTWPADWVGFEIFFTLQTPWYSKDDRPFHVLDNPLRKDRVFGVPFMAASSWKGMLRWACRMQCGLYEHLSAHQMKADGWKEPGWILHLFGNERDQQENFQSGALHFYPTWFNKIDFELINPHDRAQRAGTNPITYEVVPAGTEGILRLLYAPAPGEVRRNGVDSTACLRSLIDAVKLLLETYGISAKRTVGWGAAQIRIEKSKVWIPEDNGLGSFISRSAKTYIPPKDEFKALMDENGSPLGSLLKEGTLLSKTQFKRLGEAKPCVGESEPCTNALYEEFYLWYNEYGAEYKKSLDIEKGKGPSSQVRKLPWGEFIEAINGQNARKGK